MFVPLARENFIPLRKEDLVEVLANDPELPESDREAFRACCRLIGAIFHHESSQRLEKLLAEYGPLDPDADARLLRPLSQEEKEKRMYAVFREFGYVLEDAGYQHLSADDIQAACRNATAWGLRMDVDFRAFERLSIFIRGKALQRRQLRVWRKGYRMQQQDVPIYQRVVVILKLRPHKRLGPQINTECVYVQLFKNIPQLDINMLLPGGRVRMSYLDRSRVGLPFLSGIALTLWQVMQDIAGALLNFLNDFILFKPAAIWAAATGAFGYGIKSYHGYSQTRQRYVVSLLQLLYFQNLDTNAGVLYRLLHEAQEQDCREVMLTYFCLLRHAGDQGWTQEDIDRFIVQDLERRANLQIVFDPACLPKLVRLGLIDRPGDRYVARPLPQALASLEETWRGYFTNASVAAPVA